MPYLNCVQENATFQLIEKERLIKCQNAEFFSSYCFSDHFISFLGTHDITLSRSSSTFFRLTGSIGCYYYQAIKMNTDTNGIYTIISNSSMNTYGYLYDNSFDSTRPSQNLITSNDGSMGNGQFWIRNNLKSYHTYFLVVTTHEPDITGYVLITVVGPTSVILYSYTVTTGRLIRVSIE